MKQKTVYRAAVGIAASAAFILSWMNLAVGLIGNEGNPANLLYLMVYAVAIIGIVIARFHARGMMWAMFATAIAQLLVPVIALLIFRPPVHSTEALLGVLGVFGVNAVFAAMFAVSAMLFRRASRQNSAAPSAA